MKKEKIFMSKKFHFLNLLIFCLLINGFLFAEKNIYYFTNLEGRDNWKKEIHYFNSSNLGVNLNLRSFQTGKIFNREIPIGSYESGKLNLKKIIDNDIKKNISYLRANQNSKKLITFEVLKNFKKKKFEIVSPYGIKTSKFILPIPVYDPNNYKNIIILNENHFPVTSQIYIRDKKENKIIFSGKTEINPSTSYHIQINKLLSYGKINLTNKPILIEIFMNSPVRIFQVHGFSREENFYSLTEKKVKKYNEYFPFIETESNKSKNIIMIYNYNEIPVKLSANVFDFYDNSLRIVDSKIIQPNQLIYINLNSISEKLLFDTILYSEIETDKQIIAGLIYKDGDEDVINVINSPQLKNYSSNYSINESVGRKRNTWQTVDVYNNKTFGLIEGFVTNVVKTGSKIKASFEIKNFLSIWLEETGSYNSEGSSVYPLNLSSWMGLISPEGSIKYIGEYTGTNQKISKRYFVSMETAAIDVVSLIFQLYGIKSSYSSEFDLVNEISEIPCISDGISNYIQYLRTLKPKYAYRAYSNIKKLVKTGICQEKFKEILKRRAIEFFKPSWKKILNLFLGPLIRLSDKIVLLIQTKGRDLEVSFKYNSNEKQIEVPILSYLSPDNVEEGKFNVNIWGENFTSQSKVKYYLEFNKKLIGYLNILSLTGNEKLLVSGNSGPPGNYLISVENPGDLESEKVLLIVKPNKGKNIPRSPDNLRAIGVSLSQINLTWNDNSDDEDGFKIERKTGAGGSYSQITTVVSNITNFSNTGLNANTIYYYRIKAYNNYGNSAYSNEANATTTSDGQNSPVAKFSMTSQGKTAYENGTLNLIVASGATATVNFSAQGSYDPDGQISSYLWRINGTQVSTSRDFSFDLGKGTHQIYLTVKDNEGIEGSVGGTVIVTEEGGNQPPIARFSMSSQSKTAYENQTLNLTVATGGTASVSFSAQRSYDPDGQISSYLWRINGTQVSTSRDFSFDLGKGTHQIYLTVKDNGTLENSVGGTVIVTEVSSDPSISSINPSQVINSTFDLEIFGANFDNNAIDQIYWADDGHYVGSGSVLTRNSSYIKVREFMTGATGGRYIIKVKNSNGKLSNGVYLFVINPGIDMSPKTGPVGTTFSEWGWGFTPNNTATLWGRRPDNSVWQITTLSINSSGKFTNSFTAQTPGVNFAWWAVDDASGIKSNEVIYTVTQ